MSEFVLTPLKYIVVDRISNGVGLPAEHENPDWPRYIRTTDIAGPRALRDDIWYSQPPELLKQAGVERGDLLLTNAGTVGKAYLHTSDESAVFAGYLTRVRPNPLKADSRYVAYCCESQPYWDQINTGATRSTIDNFSSGKFQDLRISIPPLDTQRRIADMLDTETVRIDTLIEKNERVLELLSQRATALITAAVTGAVEVDQFGDPRPPRRGHVMSAGVLHNDVPLQYLAQVEYGMGQPPPLSEDGVAILRATNIERGKITVRNLQRARVDDLPLGRAPLLREGEILVVRSGAYTGDSAIVTSAWAGSAPGYDLRVTPDHALVDPRFLAWSLLSTFCLDQFNLAKLRAAQAHLNAEELAATRVPSPPLETQRRIADMLDAEIEKTDALKSTVSRQQELLRLRRQALITTAVTGQIEV